ncbi:S-layer homology domain-containing protein [Veillonella sp. VA139]|uniref:S-layer homology domain-containing protein n=1 Tax=Veillonella sp. VA139 TaxID=741830 RepID=UPI000F8EEDDA|nr:S-layer homology domain-containing protein [Veillonella sp. VA139]
MKKHLAVLAATAVLGVTSAFAANPFSDVTPQDWAYQAVAQLAAQGVVNGYPDGTFQGQNNITRYEMAQMVAKAMVQQDRVDAEQNAIINRLANEFSAELNNLGVRTATLENKVGNFKFTGDARLRYIGTNDARKSKFDYRGRVKFEATVNDNTKAVIRLSSGTRVFGENSNAADVLAVNHANAGHSGTAKLTSTNNGAEIDRVYVQHNFGKHVTASAGRQNLFIGSGLVYDDAFDGVIAMAGKDKLNATVAYGYATFEPTKRVDNEEFNAYQLNYKPVENVALSGYFGKVHEKDGVGFHGASLDVNFGRDHKFWAGAEYAKAESEGAAGEAWIAGLGYGEAEMAKVGTWGAKVQYFNAKADSPIASSTWNFVDNDKKGFLTTVDYTLAKNVGLSAYATINTKNHAEKNNNLPESYRAELNYKF